MGIFSGYFTARDYIKMRNRMAVELTRRMQAGGEEVFEVLLDLWMKEMARRGKEFLSFRHNAQSYVAIAALPHLSPTQSIDIMSQLLGSLAIKGLKGSDFSVELDNALAPVLASIQADGGEAANKAFQKLNPRSYAAIVAEPPHIGPFSHAERKKWLDSQLS
jgi:hypothetical protein